MSSAMTMLIALGWVGAFSAAASPQDGRYSNSEYGVAMTFPAGSRVCPALSGEHPHGFYAVYHGKHRTCDEMRNAPDETPVRAMGVYADYNTTDDRSLRQDLKSWCKTAEPAELDAARLDRLTVPGRVTARRVTREANGQIEINLDVAGDLSPGKVPFIFYHITLAATPRHLRRDLPMFERFVRSIRIHHRRPSP